MQDAETLARLWPFEARRELSGTDARAFEKVLQKMEAGMEAWGTPNDQTRIRETIRKLRQQVMTPPASIDTRPSLSEAPLLARPSRLNPLAREFLPSSSRLEPSIHFSNAAAERQQGIEMRRYSRL
ncbi:MAG: hypothetical protein M1835_004823 [Candelina submexicana]|nr:MAG: hypothetical protein M1835_004823 [Candelina submexicana]